MQIDGDILELHMQQFAHSNTSARTLTVCTMYKSLVLHIKFTWSIHSNVKHGGSELTMFKPF